jgi:hypothetical protein
MGLRKGLRDTGAVLAGEPGGKEFAESYLSAIKALRNPPELV